MAELQETDQIAIAILEFYGRGTNESAASGSKLHDLEPHNGQPSMAHETKAHISDTVLEALSGFVWTNEDDLLAHNTRHGQNFLHICVIGNYEKLLRFFLDHGCGDPEKLARRDDYGRTARELARVMERNEINLLLSSTRTGPPQDLWDSYEQIKYAYAWSFGVVLIPLYQNNHEVGAKVVRVTPNAFRSSGDNLGSTTIWRVAQVR